jgi:hypothetical protein
MVDVQMCRLDLRGGFAKKVTYGKIPESKNYLFF